MSPILFVIAGIFIGVFGLGLLSPFFANPHQDKDQ